MEFVVELVLFDSSHGLKGCRSAVFEVWNPLNNNMTQNIFRQSPDSTVLSTCDNPV